MLKIIFSKVEKVTGQWLSRLWMFHLYQLAGDSQPRLVMKNASLKYLFNTANYIPYPKELLVLRFQS